MTQEILKLSVKYRLIQNPKSANLPKPLLGKEGIKGRSGFTLIEVAIVLIVIGILLTIGISLIGPLTKQTKVIDSREAVKNARASLLGYAVKYGYLPTTIGPSGARELDAWGRSLVYYVPTSLGGLCTGTCTGSVCSTGVGSCGICNLTSTDRTVFECTNTTCLAYNTKSNVAFIVYSTGEDADGAGTTTKPTAGPVCPSGTCYWLREQASSDASYTLPYDDIVQYATLDEIRSAMGCSFNITTQTLPDAKVGTAYSVALNASGGQTPYTSWVTGEAQGTCAAGRVRLVASDIGICLTTASGIISGTPSTAGVYNFTVTLTDANSITTSKSITLNVLETLAITNQTLPDARTGNAYSVTLNGTGGVAPYTWSTGQAQGACPAGTVQIVATNIGLCLNTTTGVLSSAIVATPYPITAGVYNFTVTLTDANAKTATRAFTLNVIDSCLLGGMQITNAVGNMWYRRSGGACTATTTNSGITVYPGDTMTFFSNNSCATGRCTGQTLTYDFFKALDTNYNCRVGWTVAAAVTCTFNGGAPY